MSRPVPAARRFRGRTGAPSGFARLPGLPRLSSLPTLSGLLLSLAICGCDGGGTETPPPPARDCAALSDSLFPDSLRPGFAVFKVVSPDSGSFKVGTRMKVLVAGADYTSALVELVVYGAAGGVVRVPGFPDDSSIDPRVQCESEFAVPESASTDRGRRISLVSDSIKVRISDYNDLQSYDYSDSFLSITR